MNTRIALALSLLSTAPALAVAQHTGAATPKVATAAPKEASQFDFLVGQWELVVTPKVAGLAAKIHGAPRLLGTWKAWRALDGYGIQDELRIVDGSGNPSSFSTALRVYDATQHKWLSTAVDAYRARITQSTGEWKSNELVTQSSGVDAEGKPYLSRSRFLNITPTAFRYQQDRSTDNGRTWDEGTLVIVAKRVATEAPR